MSTNASTHTSRAPMDTTPKITKIPATKATLGPTSSKTPAKPHNPPPTYSQVFADDPQTATKAYEVQGAKEQARKTSATTAVKHLTTPSPAPVAIPAQISTNIGLKNSNADDTPPLAVSKNVVVLANN